MAFNLFTLLVELARAAVCCGWRRGCWAVARPAQAGGVRAGDAGLELRPDDRFCWGGGMMSFAAAAPCVRWSSR
jgi:hypothetical protein